MGAHEHEIIRGLRDDITTKRREIEELEIALRVLESRLGTAQDQGPSQASYESNDSTPPKRRVRVSYHPKGMPYAILSIKDDLDDEFDVTDVEDRLAKNGIQVEGKSPRSKIATALGRLVDANKLIRTYEGAGNVPHRYRFPDGGQMRLPTHGDNHGSDPDDPESIENLM